MNPVQLCSYLDSRHLVHRVHSTNLQAYGQLQQPEECLLLGLLPVGSAEYLSQLEIRDSWAWNGRTCAGV